MTSSPLRYRALDAALARGAIPDPVLRAGSRLGARTRVRATREGGVEGRERRLGEILERMRSGPVAELPESANDQHYELPPEFFGHFLGPRRKYSGCLWGAGVTDLAEAEEAMLALSCERAGIADGMEILDLGCGWGSMSLWLAEKYPASRILGVSNSAPQRRWIEERAAERGFADRLQIRTADVNDFDPGRKFDRVVSIEMFEHMRNWQELLRRVAGWLDPDGRLFVHVFSQRTDPYLFLDTWAAERFFTAGTMPSHELMLHFQRDLVVEESWAVNGRHYARTLEAWLQRFDASAAELRAILTADRGEAEARRLIGTWRLFLLSTAEIWAYRDGNEWLVSHYLLAPRDGEG
jgi:cyclopropane-fatty-acyl-phospholipid synthase